MKFRFAGIDSGTRRAGLVYMDYEPGGLLEISHIEHIRMDLVAWKEATISSRFQYLFDTLTLSLTLMKPTLVIVEHIRMRGGGRNLDSYVQSARAQEVAELSATHIGIPIVSLLASQVRSRLSIKGKGRVEQKKSTIRRIELIHQSALREAGMFPLTPTLDDVADAAALAMMGPTEAKKLNLM